MILELQAAIACDGFVLRPVNANDFGLIEHFASDVRVAQMTRTIPHPLPPGATEALIARATTHDRSEDIWVMDGSHHGTEHVMGLISLKHLDRHQSEVGYWVGPPWWNTGLATKALSALIAANPHQNTTLFASVFQDNPASAQVLVHCGFAYIGDAESYSVSRGATVATWTYLCNLGS